MSDFDITKVRWWNNMKLGLCCGHIKSNAECVTERAKALAGMEPDAETSAALEAAELALSESLLGVKLARRQLVKRKLAA